MAQASSSVFPETNNGPIVLLWSCLLFMAVKFRSVFPVKMKRTQDRKAVLNNGIQKKRVLFEAFERGSASAAVAPALDGMNKAVRIRTGWKRDQNGWKGDRLGCIQTHGEGDRSVHMLSLACNDVALAFFQICSAPDIYAFYSFCLELRCSCFASHAHTVIPVLWNIDEIGSIAERHWQSKVEVMKSVLYFPDMHKIQELHSLVCASCYAQYE